jgi:hypothetical protein
MDGTDAARHREVEARFKPVYFSAPIPPPGPLPELVIFSFVHFEMEDG